MDKGVNIGGEDNSVSPLIKFFIDGKQVGKSSVVKKEWFANRTLTVTVQSDKYPNIPFDIFRLDILI